MMFLAVALMAAASSAPVAWPRDVRKFIDQSELCYHWAGEEPGDSPARARESEQGRAGTCNDLSALLATLKKRYAGNPAVEALLDQYAPDSGLLKSLSGE
jgi:hypothetical protein